MLSILILPADKALLGGGFKDFYFHPYLGKVSILTNIFQMGWNHELDYWCTIKASKKSSFHIYAKKQLTHFIIQQQVSTLFQCNKKKEKTYQIFISSNPTSCCFRWFFKTWCISLAGRQAFTSTKKSPPSRHMPGPAHTFVSHSWQLNVGMPSRFFRMEKGGGGGGAGG